MMILDEYRQRYGDAWHLAAFDELLYLHRSCAATRRYRELREWVEAMVEVGVRTTGGEVESVPIVKENCQCVTA